MADKSVYMGIVILNYAFKVERVPGRFNDRLFKTVYTNTVSIGGLCIAGP